jgi:hypothetical protein
MPVYSRGIAARLIFLLCGAVSVSISAACRSMRSFFPDSPGPWLILSIVLLLVGVVSLVAAIVPRKWVVKMHGADLGNEFPGQLPTRMLLGFATLSYLLVVALALVGSSLRISPGLLYAVCPACALTITVDPSLTSVVLILAPINAAVYGAFGATVVLVGLMMAATRRRTPEKSGYR